MYKKYVWPFYRKGNKELLKYGKMPKLIHHKKNASHV